MKHLKILVSFFLLIIIISVNELFSQDTILDHETFLEELKNSEDQTYHDILQKYELYISGHPDNVPIQIEKCKFVQYAQYDEYDEYNPNQKYFDSISNMLLTNYPDHPEVLIFHTTFKWGDELKDIYEKAEISIKNNPESWSEQQLGFMYSEIAKNHLRDDDFQTAIIYADKAISKDRQYASSLFYAKILINLDRKEDALICLHKENDSTAKIWELNQKADLLLKLDDYSNALSLYKKINDIDSTYTNEAELAKTFEGIKKYDMARSYFVADTINNWNQSKASFDLFLHDLKYQSSDLCIASYNAYRAHGYAMDPLAIYRFKLFFTHPLLAWKIQDLLGILTLLLLFTFFIIVPSIWILPIYFIGHKWKIIHAIKTNSFWGLKSFWWVSSGYFIASFLSLLVAPQFINSWFNWADDGTDIVGEALGLSTLIFILLAALISFCLLNKDNIKLLLPINWTIGKTLRISIGYFVIFKIVTNIYQKAAVGVFNPSLYDLNSLSNLFLSSREDILALLSNYGNLSGYILIGILVPVYEELIFRGVLLDSCKRYITYNWANVLQAALFATIHWDLFLFPVFFIFGIIVGKLRRTSGSLLPGIIFHSINNILAVSIMISRM